MRLLAGLLIPGVTLIVVAFRAKEPTYRGHSLSYWVDNRKEFLKTQPYSSETDEFAIALRAIGTNAIPWLLAWIRCEPNPVPMDIVRRVRWSYWSTPLGHFIMYGSGFRNSRAENALLAFEALGTNAAAAVPDLTSMMKDSSHPLTSTRATMALGNLGSSGFPALADALFSTNQRERQLVALQLFELSHEPDVGTNRVLPFVVRAMHDPDPMVSNYAVGFFAKIAPDLVTNAPPK